MFLQNTVIHKCWNRNYGRDMKKLKIGIIGCGSIAESHAWAIENDGRALLSALCDTDPEKLSKLDSRRNCRLYSDWKEMLCSADIQAVALCLPHHLHEQALVDALEAGKHVICEKPLAVSLEQLARMKTAALNAEERGIFSFGIFQHRFSPLIGEVRNLIRENTLGQTLGGDITFLCTRPPAYYESDSWRGTWLEEGGGTLINQGIHTLDLLHYLIGRPESAEYRLYREKIASIEVEDKGSGELCYPRDIVKSQKISLHFENDLTTPWDPRLTLRFDRGILTLTGSSGFSCTDPELTERLEPFTDNGTSEAPGKSCYGALHRENYRDILTAMEMREKGEIYEPVVSLADLAETTETVLALYQSHFQNCPIAIPLETWVEPRILEYTGGMIKSLHRLVD